MGTASGSGPAIAELVTYLTHSQSGQISALRERIAPEHLDLLNEGLVLGEGGTDDDDAGLLDAKAEIAIAALNAAVVDLDRALVAARKKLGMLRRIQLAGQIASLLAGSAVLGAEILGQHRWTIAAAGVTLASSIAALLAQHISTSTNGQNISIQDQYRVLTECSFPARNLISELELLRKFGKIADLPEAIGKANALCETINQNAIHLF